MDSDEWQRDNLASEKTLLLILILCLTSASCQSRLPQATTPSAQVTITAQASSNRPISQLSITQSFPSPGFTATTSQFPIALSTPALTPSQVTEPVPSLTASPHSNTSTPTLLAAACELAQDLMPAQETISIPGQPFTHIWRLRNIGSCNWSNRFAIAWASGESYDSPLTIEIGASVAPGEVVELNVPMISPGIDGEYLGLWALLNPQGQRVDIAAKPDDLMSLRVRVQSNQTPSPTINNGTINGRVTRNGVPVQTGVTILLENQIYNTLMSTSTGQEGKFTFNNVPISNQGYNVVFSQELNPQYASGQVVSWAWLGPIPLTDDDPENLQDLEIDPLGFTQTNPEPNAEISAATITSGSPLRFEWQSYPSAITYWVNLTRGDRQFSVWASNFTNLTSTFFDGTLFDGTHIQEGDFWWSVGSQRSMGGYTLTVINEMIPLFITP